MLLILKLSKVLERLKLISYASSNLVIGVGGLLRYYSRYTLGFAIKTTKITVGDDEISIMKDPITDKKKKSHQRYLSLIKKDDQYQTIDNVTKEQGLLIPVFENCKLLVNYTLNGVRKLVDQSFL